MDPETAKYLIGFIGVIVSVAAFFYGRSTAIRTEGKQDGTILSELGYLKSGTDDIKRRLDRQDDRDRETIGRLTTVEESTKSAHKRIDQLCGSNTPRAHE